MKKTYQSPIFQEYFVSTDVITTSYANDKEWEFLDEAKSWN